MTIKIIKKTAEGSLIMHCEQCFTQEDSHFVSKRYAWSNFTVDTHDSHPPKRMNNIICKTCGHTFPRYSFGAARYKYLETVHLCLVIDGHYFLSKCGQMSGSITEGHIADYKKVDNSQKICKTCSRVEGVLVDIDKGWCSIQDNELEANFKRLSKSNY